MRFDLISIFPEYFDALDLSLMGKAVETGHISLGVHNLRDWTTDRHRTVDDTPYGGGAGMVMRADVWGRAIDAVSKDAGRRILALPTPSGEPLTQKVVRSLVGADQIIIACGRYEGIDARVAEYYAATDIEVLEYSIGDYVLNGGEAAALVLVEAVSRLRDGFMSNPDSLVEESFEGNILEYPAYTRPSRWQSLEVPAVLTGGNHAAIAAWRRQRALERTARRRPDLIRATDPTILTTVDRETLAACGWVADANRVWKTVTIREATPADAADLAQLAAITFPDACPPEVGPDAQADHIRRNLNIDVISDWITKERYRVLVAECEGSLISYTMIELFNEGDYPDDVPADAIAPAPAYVSKCYTHRDFRGSGISGAIMEAAVADARWKAHGTQFVLGTNRGNRRARDFYKRHGFRKKGRRVFWVGDVRNEDVVMVRPIEREIDNA
ncbi:MAG: tRNA (guanosine(37)-N1)-methyltransferase TrmD [Actinomycetaceae bacterium]|nr:tRNA (guanosine(37)-N1)-methyltransferase TrmD [Actinomycetaceae bacterium]